jgi:hypothetical protein
MGSLLQGGTVMSTQTLPCLPVAQRLLAVEKM